MQQQQRHSTIRTIQHMFYKHILHKHILHHIFCRAGSCQLALPHRGARARENDEEQVEEHFDDLGDNLSGLGGDLALYAAEVYVEELEPDLLAEKIQPEVECLMAFFFYGVSYIPTIPSVYISRNLDEAHSVMMAAGPTSTLQSSAEEKHAPPP